MTTCPNTYLWPIQHQFDIAIVHCVPVWILPSGAKVQGGGAFRPDVTKIEHVFDVQGPVVAMAHTRVRFVLSTSLHTLIHGTYFPCRLFKPYHRVLQIDIYYATASA